MARARKKTHLVILLSQTMRKHFQDWAVLNSEGCRCWTLLVIAFMAWYRRRRDYNTGVRSRTCLCLSGVSIIKNFSILSLCWACIDRYFESLNRYFRKKKLGISTIYYTPTAIHTCRTWFPISILTTVSRFAPSAPWPCKLKLASLFADWRSTKLATLILLDPSVLVAKNLSQDHVRLWRQLPWP